MYESLCSGQTICVLTWLPNIYDSNANERQAYIDLIKQVSKKNRKTPFVFFWLSAGDQLDVERQLNLGFGFPAVVVLAPHKQKMSIMRASFNKENLSDFLNNIISGRAALEDLSTKL